MGGDILCCHLLWGFLTGPLYEEGERGPFRGLLVLVVIDTTTIIPLPRGLSGLPQVLSQYAP